eukprot:gene848-4120_t
MPAGVATCTGLALFHVATVAPAAAQVGGEPRPPVDRSVEDDGARLGCPQCPHFLNG